jgi:predicted phosphodiesterase
MKGICRKALFQLVLALPLVLAACAQTGGGDATRSMDPGPRPWTDKLVAESSDTLRFAVISDLTGGERDGIFEIAVEQLNLMRPELIVSVGDLIEGGEVRTDLDRQWDSFEARAGRASARVYYTGGNHDLLGEAMRHAWEERLGARYYHFRHRDVLFLVFDTEDHSPQRLREIARMRREALEVADQQGWDAFGRTEYANLREDDSGMVSAAQSAYMLQALRDNADVRWTFLLMHKAPWTFGDMETWNTIERTLAGRDYTVFHGHRHAYRHQKRDGRDYIGLATTGGVFLPKNGPSMDHFLWVTVDDDGAHIANLKMSGVLDRTGLLPLDGEQRCLDSGDCPDN